MYAKYLLLVIMLRSWSLKSKHVKKKRKNVKCKHIKFTDHMTTKTGLLIFTILWCFPKQNIDLPYENIIYHTNLQPNIKSLYVNLFTF